MTTTLKAQQASNSAALLAWNTTDPEPASWDVERADTDNPARIPLGSLAPASRAFVDHRLAEVAPEAGVTYTLVDPAGPTDLAAAKFTVADLDVPYTYGAVDRLASTIRYTTLSDVKQVLGITDTVYDTQITQATIAAEVGIDVFNNRSLPDTGVNPELPGITEGIRMWALEGAVSVWKARIAARITAGSDDWIGTVDVDAIVRRTLRRNPMGLGLRVGWGLA